MFFGDARTMARSGRCAAGSVRRGGRRDPDPVARRPAVLRDASRRDRPGPRRGCRVLPLPESGLPAPPGTARPVAAGLGYIALRTGRAHRAGRPGRQRRPVPRQAPCPARAPAPWLGGMGCPRTALRSPTGRPPAGPRRSDGWPTASPTGSRLQRRRRSSTRTSQSCRRPGPAWPRQAPDDALPLIAGAVPVPGRAWPAPGGRNGGPQHSVDGWPPG